MWLLEKLFQKESNHSLNKEKIIKMLKLSPEKLAEFDAAYQRRCLQDGVSDNLFEVSAKEAVSLAQKTDQDVPNKIIPRIVRELLAQTSVWVFDGRNVLLQTFENNDALVPVTNKEILTLPEEQRPQLTGTLMKTDINGPSYPALLGQYGKYLELKENGRIKEAMRFYHSFRQGLDILDLDSITYAIIGKNQNSIGYWLPRMVNSVLEEGFFKIPATKIIRVPMPLLQLTRLDYFSLTPATKQIVNEYCRQAFGLNIGEEYFIKTGTYSSKFDFRNAHVAGDEVKELGEYLLYIHFQAICMAHYDLSGRNQPCTYGVSTTNEWCVREFIKDKDGRPTIYNGLPLHTEYRAFVDFDVKRVLGVHRYWDPDVMKNRFSKQEDADTAKMKHDYVTFCTCEELLQTQFEENAPLVAKHLSAVLEKQEGLTGQWSVDVMQNGDDFYFIDMAQADLSAYYNETVPENLRKKHEEDWIPVLPSREDRQ